MKAVLFFDLRAAERRRIERSAGWGSIGSSTAYGGPFRE